jgi:hypothetical protein
VNLLQLKSLFVKAGCTRLYAKPLAENDNSKNQVYFGPGFNALNLFPNTGIFSDSSPKNPIFKAKLQFGWLQENEQVADAPGAQLILYPQYPEVRFSGFLKGCKFAPSDLMAGRNTGRVLFLGVGSGRQIVGFVVGRESEVAREFLSLGLEPKAGIFIELELPSIPSSDDSRAKLLNELHRINKLGWIDSKQLDSTGVLKECNAPQCGGFTLEAELGIPKNSDAEPDYHGWEIKQHNVANFDRVEAGTITLMTPEPSGGFYKERGPEAFIRKFGYPDRNDVPDRLNFGGVHRIGQRHITTHLTMQLLGYDATRNRITDTNGCIALISDTGEMAASWAFGKILEHWSHKHSKAAYVPSQCRPKPSRQYAYGHKVRLAERTDSLRLLAALAGGDVYYDPGIKLEQASTKKPEVKRRSQFRVASKNIGALYEKVELLEV